MYILYKDHNASMDVQEFFVSDLCRREFFYGKFLAAGSRCWLPAPLERNLADAWTIVTA